MVSDRCELSLEEIAARGQARRARARARVHENTISAIQLWRRHGAYRCEISFAAIPPAVYITVYTGARTDELNQRSRTGERVTREEDVQIDTIYLAGPV